MCQKKEQELTPKHNPHEIPLNLARVRRPHLVQLVLHRSVGGHSVPLRFPILWVSGRNTCGIVVGVGSWGR